MYLTHWMYDNSDSCYQSILLSGLKVQLWSIQFSYQDWRSNYDLANSLIRVQFWSNQFWPGQFSYQDWGSNFDLLLHWQLPPEPPGLRRRPVRSSLSNTHFYLYRFFFIKNSMSSSPKLIYLWQGWQTTFRDHSCGKRLFKELKQHTERSPLRLCCKHHVHW